MLQQKRSWFTVGRYRARILVDFSDILTLFIVTCFCFWRRVRTQCLKTSIGHFLSNPYSRFMIIFPPPLPLYLLKSTVGTLILNNLRNNQSTSYRVMCIDVRLRMLKSCKPFVIPAFLKFLARRVKYKKYNNLPVTYHVTPVSVMWA